MTPGYRYDNMEHWIGYTKIYLITDSNYYNQEII